jgi:methyltransferase (TIGR00027 family)
MATASPSNHISDTALWVAVYRAMESERPDRLFQDPYARRLAGTKGEEIVATMPKGRSMAWPMIVRTAVMDEIIVRAVRRDGVDTVLNLAAGLDTRPYRLQLPPTLDWVDVDLPGILEYKRTQLAGETPVCRLDSVSVDLTDPVTRRDLLARVALSGRHALVVTEGLLAYLTPEAVAELARDLHAQPAIRWWLTDISTPRLIEMLERTWGSRLRERSVPFRFFPAEGAAFFAPHGWREIEFRSTWRESLRLRRSVPLARLWEFLGRFSSQEKRDEARRMSGIVLLART